MKVKGLRQLALTKMASNKFWQWQVEHILRTQSSPKAMALYELSKLKNKWRKHNDDL